MANQYMPRIFYDHQKTFRPPILHTYCTVPNYKFNITENKKCLGHIK